MKVKNLILTMMIFISTTLVGMGQITKPTNVTADPLNTAVSLTFTEPVVADTLDITKYQWKVVGDTIWYDAITSVTETNKVVIRGLSTGTTYSIQLRGVDGIEGVFGEPSETVQFTTKTLTAPVLTSVTRADKALLVVFAPPTSNGGNGIDAYQYTIDGGFTWETTLSVQNAFVIGGLTNGTEYRIGVRAVNSLGAGEHSNYLNGTPSTTATQPFIIRVVPYNTFVEVDVFPPFNNGGAPIETYEYSTDNGVSWNDRGTKSTSSPLVISGLSMDTVYQIRVRAVNAAGNSVPSSATETKTYNLTQPTNLVVMELDSTLSVSFDGPTVSNRGSVVTYQYNLNDSEWVDSNTNTSPVVITGLTNGVEYNLRLRAVNGGGFGLESESVSGMPFNDTIVANVQFINVSPYNVRIEVSGDTLISSLRYKNGSSYLPVFANRPVTISAFISNDVVVSWNETLDLNTNYQFILQGDGLNRPVAWKVVEGSRKTSTIPTSVQFITHHTGVTLGKVNLQRVSTGTPRVVEQLMAINMEYGNVSSFQSYGSPSISTFQLTQGSSVIGQYLFDLGGTEGKVITFFFTGRLNSPTDRLMLIGFDGNGNSYTPVVTTSVEDDSQSPVQFTLYSNFPNPFNPTTNIKFDLPEQANVKIQVVDVLGRQVLEMNEGTLSSGQKVITLDGSRLSSGVYYYKVVAEGSTKTYSQGSKFTLVK